MSANLPREPLDAKERTLADALARLPAVEPPPALDARVLAQARAALSPQRRRPRPWWISTSLGTAAAAVLAAGVAWQAGLFDIGTGSSIPVPRDRAPLSDAPDTRDAVDIDLGHRTAPSPPPPADAAAAAAQPTVPPAPPPPPAPAPAAAPAEALDGGAPATTPLRATPPVTQQRAPPPAPASPAPAEAARERSAMPQESMATDAVSVSGTRLKPEAQATLPHWRHDARLEPDAWLERVRERVRSNDRQGAVQSLRLFQQRNPSRKVPDDLVRLLAG